MIRRVYGFLCFNRILVGSLVFISLYAGAVVYAASGPFSPHQTLDPNCLPTAGTCYVTNGGSPTQILYTDGNGDTVGDANFTRDLSTQFTNITTPNLIVVSTPIFTGTGENDLQAGGTYTGTAGAVYTITITAGDPTSPNTFSWTNSHGGSGGPIAITGGAQSLNNGLIIGFGSSTRHVTSDKWVIAVDPMTSSFITSNNILGSGVQGGGVVSLDTATNAAAVFLTGGSNGLGAVQAFALGGITSAINTNLKGIGINYRDGNSADDADFSVHNGEIEGKANFWAFNNQADNQFFSLNGNGAIDVKLGDNDGAFNKTIFELNDSSKLYTFNQPNFKIDNVQYVFPSSPGAAGTVLTNDGSGILAWGPPTLGWSLTGNAGTNPATNFIGTSDTEDLIFKVDGVTSGVIDFGGQNTSFGWYSNNNTGAHNSAFGEAALGNDSGWDNVAVGWGSLDQSTADANNTAVGSQSLYRTNGGGNNTGVGRFALQTNVTGSNDIAIGSEADVLTSSTSNAIALGFDAVADSNQFVIGSTTSPISETDIILDGSGSKCVITSSGMSCPSDQRLKKDIVNLPNNILDILDQVKTVTYVWNNDTNTANTHLGFIAQNLQTLFPQVITTDAKTTYLSVNYAEMAPALVEGIRELDIKIKNITDLKNANDRTFVNELVAFFADEANGIGDFFATTIHGKTVDTQQLCVGSTCVNEIQLQQLLQLQNQMNGGTTSGSTTTGSSNTTTSTTSGTSGTSVGTTSGSTTSTDTGNDGSVTITGTTTTSTTSSDTGTTGSVTGTTGGAPSSVGDSTTTSAGVETTSGGTTTSTTTSGTSGSTTSSATSGTN